MEKKSVSLIFCHSPEESWSWQQCGVDSGSFVAEVVCLVTALFRIPSLVSLNSSDPEHCRRYSFKHLL